MDTDSASTPKCYLCQNSATRCFTVVDKEKTVRSYVCTNCPAPGLYQIQQSPSSADTIGTNIHLECGNCKTTWEASSTPLLGCSQCYETFKNVLTNFFSKSFPSLFQKEFSVDTLYPGRKPGEAITTSPMIKLIALNEALKDTLEKEDYEQAALLRDQIKQIKNQNTHE